MLKEPAKKFLKLYGCELLGPVRAFAPQRTLNGLLRQEEINLVLDVGANTGQFASELRGFGYAGRIVSFEPLSAAHAELRKRSEGDPNWMIHERTAIGSTTGSVEIHVSRNSVSSSILSMLPTHSHAEPESNFVGTETVPLNRLDDLYPLAPTDRVLLKVDVQGYERQVLEGAQRILGRCYGVTTEMSLVPLYDGQILAMEMWNTLSALGFDVWSLEPGIRHPQTGRMLQLDGLFIRRV